MTSGQARQLTKVLIVSVAALAAIYLLLLAGFGRGTPSVGQQPSEDVAALALSETEVDLPGLDVYSDVVERPLFSEDRRPEPKQAAPEPEADPEPEAPPAAPLNVALTGIIHTPATRIALVRDNSTGRSLNLRENMSLPGDQGGWLVKAIEPRRVVFEDSGNQTETSLELEIGAASKLAVAPPPQPPRQRNAAQAPPQPGVGDPDAQETAAEQDEVARRAAEIRRRIEERRAQLRREAEQSKQ